MIIVKLTGGLANQMFQYACGRFLSLKNNDELKLDLSFYQKDLPSVTKRDFELDVFNIKAQVATGAEIKKMAIQNIFVNKVLRRLPFLCFLNKKLVIENSFNFHPEVLEKKGDLYLDGYWQSEKYFKQVENIIRQDFTLKDNLMSLLDKNLLDRIKSINSVAIHVRRGDYVKNQAINQVHGTCPLGYYKKGIELIASKVVNPEFFVFSDDIVWCKENIKINFPIHFVEGNKSYEDLILMSKCKHNIIANSSFSWWAAWLNLNPQKIVIAPNRWFADKKIDTRDLIPESWLKI